MSDSEMLETCIFTIPSNSLRKVKLELYVSNFGANVS